MEYVDMVKSKNRLVIDRSLQFEQVERIWSALFSNVDLQKSLQRLDIVACGSLGRTWPFMHS